MKNFYLVCSELDNIKKIATSHNGLILSEEYSGHKTSIKCKCKHGHLWETKAENIKSGRWCPYCAKNVKYDLSFIKEFALKNNGKCLSKDYKGMLNKMEWQCSNDHKWKTTPSSIINSHTWCPHCSKNKRKTKEDILETVRQRGGKYIDGVYKNRSSVLKIECEVGHVWSTKVQNINRGNWCPQCRKRNQIVKGIT